MRGLARVLCLGVAATLCALPAATASGALRNNENLTASGMLTYTWHGDVAQGCAAAGVCDVQGELILRPTGGQAFVFGHGRTADINVDVSGVVRVLRGGAAPGECVDVPETGSGLDIRLLSATRAVLNGPADSGRCAGPVQSDLANMPIPVRESGGRRTSLDLSESRSFVAGPFAGSLVSTLALRPAAGPGPSSSQSKSFGSSSAGPRRVLEQAQLSYRVTPDGSNEIQTLFTGAQDGSCQLLDACGASGSLAFLVSRPSIFTIVAFRVVRGRASRARVLADLRHGRLSLQGATPVSAAVDESYGWGDGSSCRDSISIPAPQLQLTLGEPGPGASHGPIPVSLIGDSGPGVELLRTHCPGPADSDLIGQNQVLASGSVSAGGLLRKQVTLTLTEPSGFTGLGYTGSRSGSIQLELSLTKVRAEAITEP